MKYCLLVTQAVVVLSLVGSFQVAAQEPHPRLELGLTYGWENLTRTGPDVTASGFQSLGGPGGYVGLFLSPRLLLTASPGVTFGPQYNSFEFGSELRYLVNGANRRGPYASLGFASSWGAPGVSPGGERAIGAGVGYRIPVGNRLSLQAGLLHQRWFGDRVGQTSLNIGIGFTLGSKR